MCLKKSFIWETLNLSTCADESANTEINKKTIEEKEEETNLMCPGQRPFPLPNSVQSGVGVHKFNLTAVAANPPHNPTPGTPSSLAWDRLRDQCGGLLRTPLCFTGKQLHQC